MSRLRLLQLASAARSRDLPIAEEDGAIFVGSSRNQNATDLVLDVVGKLWGLVHFHLLCNRHHFLPMASEIEQLASVVSRGTPTLVRFQIDDKGDWHNPMLVDLPLIEIGALRGVMSNPGSPDAGVQIMRLRKRANLQFGETCVSSAAQDIESAEGLNSLPSARFQLDAELVGSRSIDYWAPVTFELAQAGSSSKMFEGTVQTAIPTGQRVETNCEGATSLIDHTAAGILSANMSSAEIIRALTVQSGEPENLLKLDVPRQEHPAEDFEILVPVRGYHVDSRLAIGEASLVPKNYGLEAITGLHDDAQTDGKHRLFTEYHNAASYAIVTVIRSMPNEAEDAGLRIIKTALAWLSTRIRFGSITLPSGKPISFSRESALGIGQTGPVVFVRGLTTNRQWLRWPSGRRAPTAVKLTSDSADIEPRLRSDLSVSESQALLAFERSTVDPDRLSQVEALWQAIEGYAAGTRMPAGPFTTDELLRISNSAPENMDARRQEKFDAAIAKFNEPSLRQRFVYRLKQDGIPVTDSELEVLFELRKIRNKLVHGKGTAKPPSYDQINYGIGIVARILTYRMGVDS